MGQFVANAKLIWDDIKHSWYFRVWALVWLTLVIMSFVVLVRLSTWSVHAGKERQLLFWIENATQVEFPKFRVSLPDDRWNKNETIVKDSFSCEHNGQNIPTRYCKGKSDYLTCAVVDTTGLFAHRENREQNRQRIRCSFETQGWHPNTNTLVAWELDEDHAIGRNAHAALWFEPRQSPGVQVNLRKAYVSYDRDELDFGKDDVEHPVWERTLVYHTTVEHKGHYNFTTFIETFMVEHLDMVDMYNGWIALGEVGGFAFFMIVLHVIVMLLVGFIFDNNSKFLSTSQGSGPENTSLLH